MTIESFQTTALQIGKIVRALTSDATGNLIFRDNLNPDGETLSRLISGLISSNISFDSSSNFYAGITNVQNALDFLNQFAYLKYTARFIYVDPTIPAEYVVSGDLYNNMNDAITYAKTLIANGYNTINILAMGSHKQNSLDTNSDNGVFTFDGTEEIILDVNGLNIIGIGNPIFRVNNCNGTNIVRKNIFNIKNNSINKSSIVFQDISFQFVNSTYTSFIKIENASQSINVKERHGVKIINSTISFTIGSQDYNRLVDFDNDSSITPTDVEIDGISMGSINNVIPSANPIQLLHINHNSQSVVIVNNLNTAHCQQPNAEENELTTNITSLEYINCKKGKCIINNCVLDEKSYWIGNLASNVTTKLLNADSSDSRISIFNIGIVRSDYNTNYEDNTGITLLKDWIVQTNNAVVNSVGGTDEIYDITVQSIPTSGTGTSGSSGTSGTSGTPELFYNVKPVKSFWNKDNIIFGLGHRNELRIGSPSNDDINNYLSKYDITNYGIPFWYNSTLKKFQFFDGTSVHTIVSATT
jgi:hypothetical protein